MRNIRKSPAGDRRKFGLFAVLTFCNFTIGTAESNAVSNCWVIVPPFDVTVTFDHSAFVGQSWSDPQSALEAGFAELVRRGPITVWGQPVLGARCNTGGSYVEYRGNISQILRLPMQASSLPGGSVVDPDTGLPVVYRQSAIFQNEFGESCYSGWYSLVTTVIAVDGNYYGKPQAKLATRSS